MTSKQLKKHKEILWDMMCGERYTYTGPTLSYEMKFSFKRLKDGLTPFVCRSINNATGDKGDWEPIQGLWGNIDEWELVEKEEDDCPF